MLHSTSPSLPTEQRPLLQKVYRHHPHGPPWYTAVQNTFSFSCKPLDFLLEMRERYGDVVSLPTLIGPWTLIFHPDGVRYVLQENHYLRVLARSQQLSTELQVVA